MNAPGFDALSVESAAVRPPQNAWQRLRANWSVRLGGAALALLVAIALAAPWLGTVDPTLFDAASRDLRPGEAGEITTLDGEQIKHTFLMGSDSFGRDIYSRVVYGTRISLLVGVSSALVALTFGILIGLSAGYLRRLDGPLMRVMDGVMAIPAILLAIALVALWKASLLTVIVAIAIPEIPRVTRLVRALVLTIREEPYVEAAVALGTPTPKIMFGHILPEHDRAAARAGHVHLRRRDPGRGDPVVPRRRAAAGHPDLGQHHGRGASAVHRLSAQRLLPRRLPRRDRAGGEHPRRRPARHARPAHGEAAVSPPGRPKGEPRRSTEVSKSDVVLDVRTCRSRSHADRPEAVSRASFDRRARRDPLSGRRVGLRQVGDRAERDGPAAENAAGHRRRGSCSTART